MGGGICGPQCGMDTYSKLVYHGRPHDVAAGLMWYHFHAAYVRCVLTIDGDTNPGSVE